MMGEPPPPPPLEFGFELELSPFILLPLRVSMLLRWQLLAAEDDVCGEAVDADDAVLAMEAGTSEEEDDRADAAGWFSSTLSHGRLADEEAGIEVPARAAIKLGEFKTALPSVSCDSE